MKNQSTKIILLSVVIFAVLAFVSMTTNSFLYPKIEHAKESWRIHKRTISSVRSNSQSRIVRVTTPTPYPTPVVSPDNPIQPRVSSAQSGDPAILNLLNFLI